MRIDILTLFPKMFRGPFEESILRRAQDKSLVEINIHNLREWAKGKHKQVDDRSYGGGVGMVLMLEPVYAALEELLKSESHLSPHTSKPTSHLTHPTSTRVVLLDAGGTPFKQAKAQKLSKLDHLILIAGHYEGVDERIRKHLVDEEISIGDYVLTGGELPAMVVVDTVVRLIPGVLEKPEATQFESFSEGLLEYPQYTRPEEFKSWKVPEVLLSGNHKQIEKWRAEKSLERTRQRRPDLIRNKQSLSSNKNE